MTDHLEEARECYDRGVKEKWDEVAVRNYNRALAAATIAIAEDVRQMRIALWGVYGALYPKRP